MAPFSRSISPSVASSFLAPSKRCVLLHVACEQAMAVSTGQSLSVQLPRPGLGDPTGSCEEALIGCSEARGPAGVAVAVSAGILTRKRRFSFGACQRRTRLGNALLMLGRS